MSDTSNGLGVGMLLGVVPTTRGKVCINVENLIQWTTGNQRSFKGISGLLGERVQSIRSLMFSDKLASGKLGSEKGYCVKTGRMYSVGDYRDFGINASRVLETATTNLDIVCEVATTVSTTIQDVYTRCGVKLQELEMVGYDKDSMSEYLLLDSTGAIPDDTQNITPVVTTPEGDANTGYTNPDLKIDGDVTPVRPQDNSDGLPITDDVNLRYPTDEKTYVGDTTGMGINGDVNPVPPKTGKDMVDAARKVVEDMQNMNGMPGVMGMVMNSVISRMPNAIKPGGDTVVGGTATVDSSDASSMSDEEMAAMLNGVTEQYNSGDAFGGSGGTTGVTGDTSGQYKGTSGYTDSSYQTDASGTLAHDTEVMKSYTEWCAQNGKTVQCDGTILGDVERERAAWQALKGGSSVDQSWGQNWGQPQNMHSDTTKSFAEDVEQVKAYEEFCKATGQPINFDGSILGDPGLEYAASVGRPLDVMAAMYSSGNGNTNAFTMTDTPGQNISFANGGQNPFVSDMGNMPDGQGMPGQNPYLDYGVPTDPQMMGMPWQNPPLEFGMSNNPEMMGMGPTFGIYDNQYAPFSSGNPYGNNGAPFGGSAMFDNQYSPFSGNNPYGEVPFGDNGMPFGGNGVPFDNGGVPFDNGGMPFGGNGVPFDNGGMPFGGNGVPFDNGGVPFGNNGAPFGNNGAPFGGQGYEPMHSDYTQSFEQDMQVVQNYVAQQQANGASLRFDGSLLGDPGLEYAASRGVSLDELAAKYGVK